ncbi:alkylglycerol monooxygenase-like [Panonychus citri]|uniref:alkylglycerol monooxygenase-like n=1 Tax=Panonychus citri TaxID=50023 RepID=UPI0023073073|nr:alkylglycerol monooxygenase-like [Panonychus citri]XP_053206898.1 alkylglycerol monooxygenase-like [Panonychus citri]
MVDTSTLESMSFSNPNETLYSSFYYDGMVSDGIGYFFNKVRFLFYLATPWETMYPRLDMVPRYVVEMFPFFVIMSVLENAVRLFTGKGILRTNDSIASLSSGIFQECLRIKVRSIEIIVYCFIHERFRLMTLPWDSVWTWYICFIAIDLGFYWAHRIAHEIAFIWAIHQNHHSGEDFTLVAALRQAVLQPFTAWFTYVPLALFIPPPIFLAHLQLGELFMFWVHTEVIGKLGPLEYILNTPSHHRVHHARNPKYIDKNYAGVLIIWDRIFGTFQEEDEKEPVAYGLVHPVESYNPFYVQFHSWYFMFKKMGEMKSFKHKIMVPFMGPGWEPGKPRLGLISDLPEIKHPVKYWDPQIPLLQKIYVIAHFGLVLLFYNELNLRKHSLTQFTITCGIISLLTSITTVGFLLEGRWFASFLELARCLAFLAAERYLLPIAAPLEHFGIYRETVLTGIRTAFKASAMLWAIVAAHVIAKRFLYKRIRSIAKFIKVQ